jgi:hypothetical protein
MKYKKLGPHFFISSRFPGRALTAASDARWSCEVSARYVPAFGIGPSGPFSDGLIAATALRHGLTIVSRNLADLETTGALLSNCWVPEEAGWSTTTTLDRKADGHLSK